MEVKGHGKEVNLGIIYNITTYLISTSVFY